VTITANKLYKPLRQYSEKRIGPSVKSVLEFCETNKDKPLDFFDEATSQGDINPTRLGTFIWMLRAYVHTCMEEECGNNEQLLSEAGTVFMEQFNKWGIAPAVALTEEPSESGLSMVPLKYRDMPWFRTNRPSIADKGGHSRKKGPDYDPVSRNQYTGEALKITNCLCEFYFGERFLPNVKPEEEYVALTWANVQESFDYKQETQLQTEAIDITSLEAQMQKMLLEDRYWKCDLPR